MKGIQNTITDNFSSILSNNQYFIVLKFQRDYSWENEQWDDLWQDILTMLEEHDEHYMGYLVLQTNGDKKYYIIDGQQRFTTIILLILATIKNINRLVEQGIAPEDNKLRIEKLTETYIGKQDPVTLKYDNILKLNRNNDAYFRDYIVRLQDLRVRNLKSTEKLMKRCFEFILYTIGIMLHYIFTIITTLKSISRKMLNPYLIFLSPIIICSRICLFHKRRFTCSHTIIIINTFNYTHLSHL